MKAHIEVPVKQEPIALGVNTKNMFLAFAAHPFTVRAWVTSAWICASERQLPGVAESVQPGAGKAPVSTHVPASDEMFLMWVVILPIVW